MSAQETTVFENCPSIGDDLQEKDWTGKNCYTLDKLKKSIDSCSNPPYFRGVKTHITDLLDLPEPKPIKEKRDQIIKRDNKDSPKKTPAKSADKSGDKSHLSRRPDHEQPSKLPDGLKRPDLEAVVDGNKIASEAQRQLYDDVKRGNCSRCHKGGHNRKDCKEPRAKWQQKSVEQKTTPKDATRPPTLHVSLKPEKRFQLLDVSSDSDDDAYTLRHYRFTLHDDDDKDNYVYVPMGEEATVDEEIVPTPLTVGAILADVDRQLAVHPVTIALAPPEGDPNDEDRAHLIRMDNHVRAVMANAYPRLLTLNTALGHTHPLTSLDEERIAAETAAMYAYYYADSSSDDEIPVDPIYEAREHRPQTPYHVPDSPFSDSPSIHGSHTHDDITYALSAASIASSRPSLPTPMMPTLDGSSSVESSSAPTPSASSPPRPRKLFKAATRDAAWPPPAVIIAETPPQWGRAPNHSVTISSLVPPLAAAPHQWGHGLHVDPAPLGQWQTFQWGGDQPHGPDPEPEPWSSRSHDASPESNQEEDEFPLSSYVQTRSSFRGGTTVNATGFVRDPLNTRQPLSTLPLTIGLDSYSDVTVAHRDIVYSIRPIHECLTTGGGNTDYHEEGLVDIVDGPCSFRTIPALVASNPTHLPTKCLLLLGVPQLNELNIKLDTHRKARRLPLESYDPSIDFSADTHLQCRMSEKDLLTWAEHNKETPVGYTKYSHLDVIYSGDTLSPDELRQLRAASAKYKTFTTPPKVPFPLSPTIPLSRLISKMDGSTCLFPYLNGVQAPQLCSHAGQKKC
jgi:hypothetical protein